MYFQAENVKYKVDMDRQLTPVSMNLIIIPVIIPLINTKTGLI